MSSPSERSAESLAFATGNAAVDGAPFGGWFVGDLQRWTSERAPGGVDPSAFGLRESAELQVKWGIHPARQTRPAGWAPVSPVVTLSVLISGRFRVVFRSREGGPERDVLLAEPGDYVISGTDSEHIWHALADSVVLSVRWPESRPDRSLTA